MNNPQYRIEELESENSQLRVEVTQKDRTISKKQKEIDDSNAAMGGCGFVGFLLGLAAFFFVGTKFLPPNTGPDEISISVEAQDLDDVIKQSTDKNLLMVGEMKCRDHDPTHAASTHSERKKLSDKHGCSEWSFTGTLTNKVGGIMAERRELKSATNPPEK